MEDRGWPGLKKMKTFFLIWQIFTGMLAVAGLLVLLAIVFAQRDCFRQGNCGRFTLQVVQLFASGFTKSTVAKGSDRLGGIAAIGGAGDALYCHDRDALHAGCQEFFCTSSPR